MSQGPAEGAIIQQEIKPEGSSSLYACLLSLPCESYFKGTAPSHIKAGEKYRIKQFSARDLNLKGHYKLNT